MPSVDANANPPRGVDFCETQFPVDGGLMTSGVISNNGDSGIGAYGLGIQVLGIGKTEKTVTEDLSLNFKWRPAERWFVELDAQKTKASASSTEVWGGSQTWADAYIEPGLDNPKVTLTTNPQTQIHAGNVAGAVQTGVDSNGDPVYAYTPGVQTSTADPNASFWLYAGEGHHDGTGDLTAVKADVQYEFAGETWFKSVKFGTRYSERSQINKEMDVNWASVAPSWDDTGLGLFATETTPAYTTVDFSDFYRGGVLQGDNTKFLAISSELLLDPVKLANYINNEPTFNNADGSSKVGWKTQLNADGSVNYDPARISDVTEKTTNLYAMMNFDKAFDNGMSIDGNFGVRYTSTELHSSGYLAYKAFDEDSQTTSTQAAPRTDDAESRDAPQDFLPETTLYLQTAATPQTVNQKDSHWLPSFNLKWNLNSEMLIRFGASQNLSRPNIQDMRAGQVVNAVTSNAKYTEITDKTDPLYGVDRGYSNISLDQIRITGGNPNLKPTTSNNYDVSWEWYFKGGTVSTALFQKDLKNIIQNGDITMGSTTLDGKTVNIVYSGLVNVDTASVKGVELAYQQFYDFLPGVFSHLGLQSNFTFVDASAEPPPPYVDANGDGVPDDFGTIYRFGVKDLLGQSKYIFNIVGIYQDKKWEGRVAYNWRSENLTSYRDYITGDPIYLGDVGFLDASLKYNVNRNLQISLNASNILDTKNKAYAQVNADGQRVDRFSFLNDRRFVLDIRYQY
ncbi:TonB-dependent receptor [Asticcacaulis sp. MM231]|uniref:TonB-dependent receptor n=1 Tax=Asticcacaulis sp. MM231 TaxID=3157666 RepID=UPI0032D58647